MQQNITINLEKALGEMEVSSGKSTKAAQAALQVARRLQKAAKDGNLKELRASFDALEKAEQQLRQQFAETKAGWTLNEDVYLASPAFTQEVLSIAREKGVNVYERDDRLYCYPVLMQVSPKDKAVRINKTLEKRVRPSVLIEHLKALQTKPPRFSPEAFLKSLRAAYKKAAEARRGGMIEMPEGMVIPLMELYEMFTLLPGQAKEYSKQEFARDIYLLHRSGKLTTEDGLTASFPASTITRQQSKVLTVVKEDGETKPYWGIEFSRRQAR